MPRIRSGRPAAAAALVVALAGLGAGCRRPPAPAGSSLIETFGRGTFVTAEPLLELRARDDDAPPTPSAHALGEGWAKAEAWGTWALGPRSTLDLYLPAAEDRELLLEGWAAEDAAGRPQHAAVTVNGTPVGSLAIADGPPARGARLAVPAGALRRGVNRVALAWHRQADGSARDRRPLAAAVHRIGLVPPGTTPPAPGEQPPFRLAPARDALFLLRPGTFLVPLEVPADAEAVTFAVRGADGRHNRLVTGLMTLDGEERLEPLDGDGNRQRIPLAAQRGRPVLLLLQLAAVAEGARVELRAPQLERTATAAAEPATPSAGGERRPDLVLIVLDAARADHFGVYGYPRDTTPNIDRLAADGWTFGAIYAECPYTVCASPSLLTGLPFTRHGVVDRQLTIAEEVETLAETLRAAGYRTIGYSANPNNGKAAGADHGFDEFTEVWRQGRGRADPHPRRLTAMVTERLAGGLGERPLFLFLHYVPPHAPYAPDPEHDRFGDPAYRGPVTSDPAQTRAIVRGEMAIDDADLAELVSLYDGNLHMADAHVAQVLDALRRAGRLEQAVIAVTADHGEAFMEHGAVGHNTTLYDEMLQVPLVIRPPGGAGRRPVELDRLGSLYDVAPTLLDLLGPLAPPAGMAGRSLLAPAGGERPLVLRSGHVEQPIYGLRSERFKLMVRGGTLRRLYDLRADPEERTDLAPRRPLLFAGLERFLAAGLNAGRGAIEAPETLTEEERKTLEALGYL